MGLIGGTSMGYAYARARDGVVRRAGPRRRAGGGRADRRRRVTETELRRAKAQFERHWLHELARIDSRADAFGEFATLYDDPELVNTRLDQIDAVDTAAVAAALRPAWPRPTAPP